MAYGKSYGRGGSSGGGQRKRKDGPELHFITGVYENENKGKVFARARFTISDAMKALKAADKDTALDDKAVLLVLNSESDKADYWLAVAGVSEEDAEKGRGRPSRDSKSSRRRDDDDEDDEKNDRSSKKGKRRDEEDEEEESDTKDDDDKWDKD